MPKPPSEWDASTYHRVSSPQYGWGQKVLDRLSLQGNETVVDAGCGTGRLTAELLDRLPNGRVIALDNSQSMLDQARAFLSPRYGDRVSYLRADLHALALDQVADGIFSTATFHWVLDHDALFNGLFRALRPGGWLVAQCGGGANLARIHHRAEELMSQPPYAPHYQGWTDPWLFADAPTTAARMERAGFVQVKTWIEEAPTTFAGPAEMGEFIHSVVLRVHLARLPDEALRKRFVAALVERASHDSPPYTLDYWRLNLEAKRP